MQQLLNVWNGLSFNRKIVTVAATIGVFFAVLGMARMISEPSLSLLYSGLEPSTAGEVVAAIEQSGVAYQVRGGAIFVDAGQRDQLRMTLASEGLPANSSGGYELLDNLSGFGTTSQMFDAAYWRAKEGELARTIVSSPHINSARVHIANGSTNPFQRSINPTASVAVSAVGGHITNGQAKALKFLVASAVAGLMPADVTVIGSNGEILGGSEDPTQAAAAEEQAERLKAKVERLLEARVGPGNAIVEATVDTVTESERIRELSSDPDGRIAISTDTEETSNQSSQSGDGQVTVASNLPDGDAAGGNNSNSQNNRSRQRTNYWVPEVEREIVRGPGAVKRITVAVLVNGSPVEQPDGSVEMQARDEAEIASLTELVESAVGFNPDRGDVITIKSMGLQAVEPMGTSVERSFLDSIALDIMSIIQMAVLAVVALILGLFVVRPLLAAGQSNGQADGASLPAPEAQQLTSDVSESESAIGNDGDAAEAPGLLSAASDLSGEPQELIDLPMMPMMGMADDPAARLRNMIEERQSETVEILRGWLEAKDEAA